MQAKKLFSYLGLCAAVVGTAVFVFLYCYPYETIDYELVKNRHSDLSALNLSSKKIDIAGNYEEFSSEISSYLISSATEYRVFVENANFSTAKTYGAEFFATNNLLVTSFRGSLITYSKPSKLGIDNSQINITIGVENDMILTGNGNKDDNIYNYYIFSIDNKDYINQVNLSFKKI